VGLGAVGSLAPVPLFGVSGAPVETSGDLLAGHLVIGGGFADGTAYAVRGGDDPAADIVFRSRERSGGSPVNLDVVTQATFGSGLVRLDVVDGHQPLLVVADLAAHEDPLLRFYTIARKLRGQIRDEAVRALGRWHEDLRRGVQIVTVVGEPLAGRVVAAPPGEWSATRLVVSVTYEHWLVRGKVEARDLYSTTGEYPLDDDLDVDLLVWIDERVRDGRIALPHHRTT